MTKKDRERQVRVFHAFNRIVELLLEGHIIRAYNLAKEWRDQIQGELNT